MSRPSERPTNFLLSSLSRDDLEMLRPHLEDVTLSIRQVIESRGTPIAQVHFPTAGIISVVARGARDEEIEAGLIGREGMTGIAVVLGDTQTRNDVFVQVAGSSKRIRTDRLLEAIRESRSLQSCFLRYIHIFTLQTAQTALANGRAKIEERLARWLLMAQDRLGASELPLTHEFLGLMLGVRRAGVTVALHALESNALISANRGLVTILDRPGLEELAGGIYGVPEADYRRLFPQS